VPAEQKVLHRIALTYLQLPADCMRMLRGSALVRARAFIIAAPNSGAGKTIVTLAVLSALARRGMAVRAAKAGPDYIDPAFHTAAIGISSINLDSWAMPKELLSALAVQAAAGGDILVIEGVMGLFDGAAAAAGRRGATADLAAQFALPVVLVLDVARQAQSAAAVVRGFATHDPAVRIAGVILNRCASERHRALVGDAIQEAGFAVFGALPQDAALTLPERHLGLVQAAEHADLAAFTARLAEKAEHHLALDAILACARPLSAEAPPAAACRTPALPPPGQRIALASDAAFSFVYPHLVATWREAGAEIKTFSPLTDQAPPEDADCCWLPGGYPELHAGALAAAQGFSTGLRRFAETRPVHGECGGYMVLGQELEDAAGRRHVMTGLLGHSTSFAKRKLHLGYRSARLLVDSVLGRRGAVIRGHEFHYASLTGACGDGPLAEIADTQGRIVETGGRRGRVTGAFFHAIAAAQAFS
jgi:cobyrinic acid a,c-diamide synthase